MKFLPKIKIFSQQPTPTKKSEPESVHASSSNYQFTGNIEHRGHVKPQRCSQQNPVSRILYRTKGLLQQNRLVTICGLHLTLNPMKELCVCVFKGKVPFIRKLVI